MRILITIICFIGFFSIGMAQGSCGSEDGVMLEAASTPPDFQWLEDNGYCMNGTGNTAWHFMCFTFTPDISAVDINMGVSATCNSVNTKDYTLYDNTCTSVGTGLSYTGLTEGDEYTFCVNMKAGGGPSCNGFDRVCPYWIAGTPLPIDLIEFKCEQKHAYWSTSTEIQNDRFEINSDSSVIATIIGAGYSYNRIDYIYKLDKCYEYISLVQIDYDGKKTTHGTAKCNCPEPDKPLEIIAVYNLLGQQVEMKPGGIYIVRYSNGETKITK
jgi:hypothetical protein